MHRIDLGSLRLNTICRLYIAIWKLNILFVFKIKYQLKCLKKYTKKEIEFKEICKYHPLHRYWKLKNKWICD